MAFGFDDVLSFVGDVGKGILGYIGADRQQAKNQEMYWQSRQDQMDLAKNSIQYRVADAEKAGINPLYAIGAPTMSISPQAVGAVNTYSPLADMSQNLGQDLSRAASANRSQLGRDKLVSEKVQDLSVKNMELRNDLLAAQIRRMSNPSQAQVGPSAPDDIDDAKAAVYKDIPGDEPSKQKVIKLWNGNLPTHPGTSTAQDIEDTYGDDGPLSWVLNAIFGGTHLTYGAFKHIQQQYYNERARAAGKSMRREGSMYVPKRYRD